MHTVSQLKPGMFALRVGGAEAPVETLLDWQSHDRLGVVMTTPFGALGASLAIQLAIASHAGHDGGRRLATAWYAEIYLFHVGGRWGDFSLFDFWPSRRDVFLPGDARAVLAAINSHGITHLLVPDGAADSVVHDFKEPEAAHDRLKLCLAYDPSGDTANADIVLSSDDPVMLENMRDTLWPEPLLEQPVDAARAADPLRLADHLRWRVAVRARLNELAPTARATSQQRATALINAGRIRETYRRVTSAWALQRLGPA